MDLPSYQELSQQIQGAKPLFTGRDRRDEVLEIEGKLDRLTKVVDEFYDRLGPRNWIFHEMLNASKIEALLAETSTPEAAEARLIELHQDVLTTQFWTLPLRAHEGLLARLRQIERSGEHYRARQFDSCVLQLIAVMDGFVNDFEPSARRGLASREPDEMAAWDSVVGHHMGLSHAMRAFRRTIKRRIDSEVKDVYRNGIVHGMVVNFDNIVVATKAWNMLFAVADWATATSKAAEPKQTWSDTWSALLRHAEYRRHEQEFVPSEFAPADTSVEDDELMLRARGLLDAWQHKRWGLFVAFTPPPLLGSKSDGEAARFAKGVFSSYDLTGWDIVSVGRDQPSSAEIRARAIVNGETREMRFRMTLWTPDGKVGAPGDTEATWHLAVWAPRRYFTQTA
jgi:hypothetical protein